VFQEGHVTVVQDWLVFFLLVSAASLMVASLFTRRGMAAEQIAANIKEGTVAFLKRQYKTVVALLCLLLPTFAYAQTEHAGGGEANLVLPDLRTVHHFGMDGHALLLVGLLCCFAGLLFGLVKSPN
jgi:K(+)-stimulated pyrophosphate-energized sodium pump